ncbi:hypothetical protein ER308_02060 [Egibacter rhizosphaerae]|uniref:Uncharacterized protein n=1 Tax=Egibacter rhizosphaerae TaxID=1670831 RepID=A0A411YBC9_9ACTN|nr:hypothetical protein [Egibacter rhizosphaerae]QBI18467.1 hypothetical protein ER308_02060 [Egibacter rhizosphaerae]
MHFIQDELVKVVAEERQQGLRAAAARRRAAPVSRPAPRVALARAMALGAAFATVILVVLVTVPAAQ